MTHAEIIANLQNAKGPFGDNEAIELAQAFYDLHKEKLSASDLVRFIKALKKHPLSLAYAVALVESVRPGWVWEIYSDCSARIWEDVVRRYPPDFPATAATPAIALCIALMKSMEK